MVYINSILYACQEKIGSFFKYFGVYWKHAWIKYGACLNHVPNSIKEHVDALFIACMVVHVSSFLEEVCKHILNTGWKQVWKESILIIIKVSIRRKVA